MGVWHGWQREEKEAVCKGGGSVEVGREKKREEEERNKEAPKRFMSVERKSQKTNT